MTSQGFIEQWRGDLMTKQDPEIGQVTREDLREGIRVNEALLRAAQGDLEYLDARLTTCDERIKAQQDLKEHWRELAELAPRRVEALSTKLAQQRAQLESWRAPATSQARQTESKNARVKALVDRIAKGDLTAIAELQKLTK